MPEDPAQVLDEIIEIMAEGMETQSADPKKRSQHPQAQGILYGHFCVEQATLDALPPELESLKVGLLSQVKNYPSWIRFSNASKTDDSKGDIHGLAIKILEVEGESLTEDSDGVQDFALIDVPVFFLPNRVAYRDFFRAISSLKKLSSANGIGRKLVGLGKVIKHVRQFLMPPSPIPWRFGNVRTLLKFRREKKRHKPNTLLSEQFWSPTPIQWGDKTVKISFRPWDLNAAPKVKYTPDYLRQQLIQRLTVDRQEAVFDVLLEVAVENEPGVDDPTLLWTDSQTVKVATLRIPPQKFTRAEQEIFGEQLSFSPWHGITAHRPVGDLNEIRLRVYEAMSELREPQERVLPHYKPEEFQPTLLSETPLTEQAGITIFAPIKPDHIPNLKDALSEFDHGEGFGRSPLTHFARFVIFEDNDLGFPSQLLFSTNFDGPQEKYIEELVKNLGADLDTIFCHCESYEPGSALNFLKFKDFIGCLDIPIPAFYVGCRGMSAEQILKNQQLRERLYGHMQEETEVRQEILKLHDFTSPTPPRPEPSEKLGFVVAIGRWLAHRVWFLIGVDPTQNDPSARESYTDYARDRMDKCAEEEDVKERVQNQLSTLSRVKSDFHLFTLRIVLKLVNTVGGLSRGTLSGIATIHFARWVILEKGTIEDDYAYLFFESNYGDTWDNYLEDFVYLTITAMNSIWANLEGYPKNGCQDVELFKRHSKTRQFPAQVYYSAYPGVSVKNILSDRKLSEAMGVVGQFVQGRYRVMQDVDDHPLMRLTKRINRMG